MASTTTYSYSIVPIASADVLKGIMKYQYKVHAYKISEDKMLTENDYSLGQLYDMVKSTDYLFFYIKEDSTTVTEE